MNITDSHGSREFTDRQDLGRKSLLLFVTTWGTTVLGMSISLLVARRLGPAAIGSIGFSLGLAGMAMAALLPGCGQAHLKRLAEGQDPGRCLGTMGTIQLAMTALLLMALGGLAAMRGLLETTELTAVFLLMLAAQIAGNFADIALRVFLAREWIVPHAMILLGGRVVRLVTTVAVLVWIPRVTWIAATFALEGALNCAIAMALLMGPFRIRVRPPTRESLAGYWKYARPFLVTTPLALIQDSVDRYAVGRWAGLTAAGYYHVARALWEVLSSLLAPPATFIFTRLSSLYARRTSAGDREARDFFRGAVDKVFFVTIPVAFAFWAFAEPLTTLLYGAPFAPVAPTLRILVLAAVAMTIVNPYTLIMYALEKAARLISVNVVRFGVYLALLLALVPGQPELATLTGPWSGDRGAALARLALVVFPAWMYWRWTREEAGIPFYRRTWIYLFGFALMVLVREMLVRLAESLDGAFTVSVVATIAALTVYAAFLRAVHPELSPNLAYARALLSPARFRTFLRRGFRDV